jgi:D-threo-aldose 1-dehydrogenase
MTDPLEPRSLGRGGLRVTRLGLGGVPLGDPHGSIDEARAALVLETAYASGISYFDTAPWYGMGRSEHRMEALKADGMPRRDTPTP